MAFIDEAEIQVVGGHGGRGCVAFRREKYIPRGGPAGGNGGDGGWVEVVGDRNLNTLHHLRYHPRFAAENGRPGEGSNRTGRSGENEEVRVPLGTLIYARDSDEVIGEILEEGQRLQVAKGGRGGRGNAHFTSSTHRTPRFAQPGEEGEDRHLRLELKLLADVGLVGLPNAGKSTLISSLSAARPKIADYPFTTLTPQLGVVADGPLSTPFVIADLPGLISGAADGAGLGHQFLRHVERCRILVHLVDLASAEGSVVDDLATIEAELAGFNPDLLLRQRLVVGSKLDAACDERRKELRAAASERRLPYFEISSVTHRGVRSLVDVLRQRLREPSEGEL